jgi:hypothetical protein
MCIDTRTSFRIALLMLLLPAVMMSTTIDAAESVPGSDVELAAAAAASSNNTAPITSGSEGREFYIAFGPSVTGYADPLLFLSISSAHAQAQITIEVPPGQGNSSNLQVEADGTAMHILPNILRQVNSNVSEPLVVKVTSLGSMVSLSGWVTNFFASEAYLALPLEALGTRYIVPSIITVVADDNDRFVGYIQIVTTDAQPFTNITVTTRVTTSSGLAGTYHLALAARMAWLITTATLYDDLGGTDITGSAPFGVIAGHECTQVPAGEIGSCMHGIRSNTYRPPRASQRQTDDSYTFYASRNILLVHKLKERKNRP